MISKLARSINRAAMPRIIKIFDAYKVLVSGFEPKSRQGRIVISQWH